MCCKHVINLMEIKVFKKTLMCVVVAMLSGCNDSNDASTKISSAKVESNKSATAIYFPGGGIDFGRKPVSDNSKNDESGAHIGSITFAFDDDMEKISKLTSPVMTAQGYTEIKRTHANCKLCMVYSKDKVEIAFVYNPVSREGLDDGSTLLIWWKEKK